MSKFVIGVSAGIAKVYPYGQGSAVETVLKEGEALLCQVPVGPHPEPYAKAAQQGVITDPDSVVIPEPPSTPPSLDEATKESLRNMAQEDKDAPAAGVDNDSPPGNRAGTVLVAVLEGTVTLRLYEGSQFVEEKLEQGQNASIEVTESNRITLAVYDAAPKVDPRK